jgi:hypothetical protein
MSQFSPYQVADDVNYPLITVLSASFSDEELKNFIKSVQDNAKKNKNNVITLEDIELAIINLRQSAPIKKFYANAGLIDRIGADAWFLYNNGYNWLFPSYKKQAAYHEAAHALIYVLKDRGSNALGLSMKLGLGNGGVVMSMKNNRSSLARSKLDTQYTSLMHDRVIENLKNKIMGSLAGGIGEQIYTGKRLSFDDFLSAFKSSIGTKGGEGTDYNNAYEAATTYILNKDKDIVFDEDIKKYLDDIILSSFEENFHDRLDKEAHAFLEECYEQTFDILEKHKATLDALVQEALKDDVLAGSKIYEIVGKERPKYDEELTGGEKMFKTLAEWLSWTVKRMNVYQTHESGEHA